MRIPATIAQIANVKLLASAFAQGVSAGADKVKVKISEHQKAIDIKLRKLPRHLKFQIACSALGERDDAPDVLYTIGTTHKGFIGISNVNHWMRTEGGPGRAPDPPRVACFKDRQRACGYAVEGNMLHENGKNLHEQTKAFQKVLEKVDVNSRTFNKGDVIQKAGVEFPALYFVQEGTVMGQLHTPPTADRPDGGRVIVEIVRGFPGRWEVLGTMALHHEAKICNPLEYVVQSQSATVARVKVKQIEELDDTTANFLKSLHLHSLFQYKIKVWLGMDRFASSADLKTVTAGHWNKMRAAGLIHKSGEHNAWANSLEAASLALDTDAKEEAAVKMQSLFRGKKDRKFVAQKNDSRAAQEKALHFSSTHAMPGFLPSPRPSPRPG